MKKQTVSRIHDLLGLLHALYPPALAEDWDNVGLQVGDLDAPVTRVLVCLDPTATTLDEAEQVGAQALLAHHPLLFRPVKNIVAHDPTGALAQRAIRAGIAVLAAHTNLDCAANGLNDWLAAALGLEQTQPLQNAAAPLLKLVVTVPVGYEDQVSEALYAGGAGKLGAYDRCSFRSEGLGTFRPGTAAHPFIGTAHTTETVREFRLETILPAEHVSRVLTKLRKAHPYEEIACDLIPLRNHRPGVGLGRIGRLAEPLSLSAFASRVRQTLGPAVLRQVGDGALRVAKVAVCGGSGAGLIAEAARQGADVLVTGDLKYHEAQNALSRGLAVLDAGHFATERLMVPHLAATLQDAAEQRGVALEFILSTTDRDPFSLV